MPIILEVGIWHERFEQIDELPIRERAKGSPLTAASRSLCHDFRSEPAAHARLAKGEAGLRAEPKDAGACLVDARAKDLSGLGAKRQIGSPQQGEAVLRAEPKDAGAYLVDARAKDLSGFGAKRQILKIGSSGRTRTYNPSVNSRMLCH